MLKNNNSKHEDTVMVELYEGVTRRDIISPSKCSLTIASLSSNASTIFVSDDSRKLHEKERQDGIDSLNPGEELSYKIKGVKTLFFRSNTPSQIILLSCKDNKLTKRRK